MGFGRLGFDKFASVESEFRLTVEDPDSILPPLPASVSIPADSDQVRVPLALNDVAGRAAIHVACGDYAMEVVVVSRTQSMSEIPLIRIPLGAEAMVPVKLAWPERDRREAERAAKEAEKEAGEGQDAG